MFFRRVDVYLFNMIVVYKKVSIVIPVRLQYVILLNTTFEVVYNSIIYNNVKVYLPLIRLVLCDVSQFLECNYLKNLRNHSIILITMCLSLIHLHHESY